MPEPEPQPQLTAEQQAIIDAAMQRAAETSQRAQSMTSEERASWGITTNTVEEQGKKDEDANPSKK